MSEDYGVDVSANQVGGVFKKIIKEGVGSKSPQANSEVKLVSVSCDASA
jgi:hypothetical protein